MALSAVPLTGLILRTRLLRDISMLGMGRHRLGSGPSPSRSRPTPRYPGTQLPSFHAVVASANPDKNGKLPMMGREYRNI